ncbi:hypothetical protein WMY93_021682 [Mugilogobius chulae]|uniref:Leucine rich repeat neuronal 3 n=1 Tax=Mugilogobius chulae TaxID=88201 RepID=A0AAW0NLV2_9GOBI
MASFVAASEDKLDCPKLCVCEVRPWFSPSSLYMESLTIDCNDLGLFNIPEKLPLATQVLLLQTNNIVKVDTPLDYLANITEIDLSQNNVASLSDVHLGNLPQLLSLHLEENLIPELPERCLSELSNLQELYLNHNLISSISPLAFQGLSSLVRLHLNSNKLKTINREWFDAMPNLEILMIGENPVVSIENMNFKPLALKNVKSLKFLDLNKNPISRIQRGDFVDMFHLKELGINSMPELVSIDSFALSNLPELTKIEATNNPKLSYIHPNAFYKLPRLETLMLNGNALSALHQITVESLPNLREVSMHSNPIRCDCVVRWMNMNKTNIRFMEPDSLFCVEPPEYEGQHVRQVHFREMMEICLPLISPESMPRHVKTQNGSSVSLHCRAFAEPEPEIYWITPSGMRILPNTVSDKYYMHPEGTFDIYDITENEAGLYTCVAHNLVGADLKSVSVEVNGYFPQPANGSLNVIINSVETNSVLLSWKAGPGTLAPNIKWYTMSERDHPRTAFTTRVPSDIRAYNLTHLSPATQYKVCVEVHGIHYNHETKCLDVTTKGIELAVRDTEKWDAAVITIFGVLLATTSVACLLIYVSLRNHHLYGQIRKCESKVALTPGEAKSINSSFFTKLWFAGKGLPSGVEVKATVINVSDNAF